MHLQNREKETLLFFLAHHFKLYTKKTFYTSFFLPSHHFYRNKQSYVHSMEEAFLIKTFI